MDFRKRFVSFTSTVFVITLSLLILMPGMVFSHRIHGMNPIKPKAVDTNMVSEGKLVLTMLTRRICNPLPASTPTPPGLPTPTPGLNPSGRILNGNFERGSGFAWIEASISTDFPYPIVTDDEAFVPCRGSYYAWLGKIHENESQIYQLITVPADLDLYWHYRIASGETCGARYDVGYVGLSLDGNTYFRIQDYDLCSGNSHGYYQLDSIDLSDYAGRPVLLVFGAITDDSILSNFFIDDVGFRSSVAEEETPLQPIVSGTGLVIYPQE